MKKFLILILLFYFLVIFQESFLSHFTLFGARINLILISVFLLVFFEENFDSENLGIFSGFLGGTISDLFSHFPFGIFAFNLTSTAFLTKKISKFFKKSNILAFSLLFLVYFSFYKALLIFENFTSLLFFEKSLGISFNLIPFFLEFLLSFILVLLILFVFKKHVIFLQQ